MIEPPNLFQSFADAARFILSLAESGGRLVVVTPCEHGVFNPHYDGGSGLGCPGSSRKVVWPEEEGE
jgi:hypothetical protein